MGRNYFQDDDHDNDKQQAGGKNNPYLAVKQKLRPAGSEHLGQQHKHQHEAVSAGGDDDDEDPRHSEFSAFLQKDRLVSGSSSSRRSSGTSRWTKHRQMSSWKKRIYSTFYAVYSFTCRLLSYLMLLATAFAIGFYLPTVKFVENGTRKEVIIAHASSAILLSLLFHQCFSGSSSARTGKFDGRSSRAKQKDNNNYIHVRDRLHKASMTKKEGQQQTMQQKQKTTTITTRFFLFLYSCLSFVSLVVTCGTVGFYYYHKDSDYLTLTATVCMLTIWFHQRLALVWQTSFAIGYYFYHHDSLPTSFDMDDYKNIMDLFPTVMLAVSVLVLTAMAELLCGGNLRHPLQAQKSSKTSTASPRKSRRSSLFAWFSSLIRTSRTSGSAASSPSSPSAADYDDNPNDPYAQVRQSLRKSPTTHKATLSSATLQPPPETKAYMSVRQSLHHVKDVENESMAQQQGPVIKANEPPTKAKDAARDLSLEKTMQMLMEQKSLAAPTGMQVQEPTAASGKTGVLKSSPVPEKAKEAARDLKLEETMRTFLEQKNQLNNSGTELPLSSEPASSGSQQEGGIIKTAPVAEHAKEGARDLKLEETMRICLEQKSRLKKRGDPK